MRAGNRRGAGRISARIASDGPTLVVETLDIADLAGANARVNGRIARDGSGRIAGKMTAPRAAPLVDLLGTVWVGGVAQLVPPFLREGALDLDIVVERTPPQPGARAPEDDGPRPSRRRRFRRRGRDRRRLDAAARCQTHHRYRALDRSTRRRRVAAPVADDHQRHARGLRRFSLTGSGRSAACG